MGHGVAGRNGVAKGRRSAREPDHWVIRWTGKMPQRPRPVSRLNVARATLSGGGGGGGDYRSLPVRPCPSPTRTLYLTRTLRAA